MKVIGSGWRISDTSHPPPEDKEVMVNDVGRGGGIWMYARMVNGKWIDRNGDELIHVEWWNTIEGNVDPDGLYVQGLK